MYLMAIQTILSLMRRHVVKWLAFSSCRISCSALTAADSRHYAVLCIWLRICAANLGPYEGGCLCLDNLHPPLPALSA